MGRIPKSKRHKKVKFVDPCYKGTALRSKERRNLPNEPPRNEDHQEVPRPMEELIYVKNVVKTKKVKRKKNNTKKDNFIIVKRDRMEENQTGMIKPVKSIPDIVKQRKFESKRQFFDRLQHMADFAIAEAKIEEKYNIDLINVDTKGNAQFVNAPKEVTAKKREKCKKYKGSGMKRQKIEDQQFEFRKEKIQFGDVAFAPPFLTAKPRKAPEVNKPGKKNLVLNHLLNSVKQSSSGDKNAHVLQSKWRSMSSERQKVVESERLRAVEMYRLLKKRHIVY